MERKEKPKFGAVRPDLDDDIQSPISDHFWCTGQDKQSLEPRNKCVEELARTAFTQLSYHA